jgi:hypothetical protein
MLDGVQRAREYCQRGAKGQSRKWMRCNCCALILLFPFAEKLQARDFLIKNDSLQEGQTGYIQTGFVNGDIGAAVFDLPCGFFPLKIKALQIYWRAQAEPASQVMAHVRVYPNGAPNPGQALYSAEGAIMTAGYMNEIAAPSPTWILPAGPFTVGIEYVTDLDAPVGAWSGHLTSDSDGCQPGRNLVFDSASAQWLNLCALGMSGDLVIRVLAQPTSARCFGDANCDGDVDLLDYLMFQTCFSGPDAEATSACQLFDCDADTFVGPTDFASLAPRLGGPQVSCNMSRGSCATARRTDTSPATTQTLLLGGMARQLAGRVDAEALRAFLNDLRTHEADGGSRFTLAEIIIAIVILVIVGAGLIGSCWYYSCRATRQAEFLSEAVNPTDTEQLRINEGLDWLLYSGDNEAYECALWYDEHLARMPWSGTIMVNHWANREGFVAQRSRLQDNVFVHADFVTGPPASAQLLGLLFYAEWQHIDHPSQSEQQCQQQLNQFRERLNVVELHPEIQHGWGEGGGG